jgi:hypothetical protein
MKDLFKLILGVLASLFKSRAKLEAEILILCVPKIRFCNTGDEGRREQAAI